MTYLYFQYRKYYFYLSVGWFFAHSILSYKDIINLIDGSAGGKIIFLLFLRLIFFPILFAAIGFYFKSVSIVTDDNGLKFTSWFKNIAFRWEEINVVKRNGSRIIIQRGNEIISFRPIITSLSSITRINPRENIFKQSELLKEIYVKAKNAQFKDFPEDTL